MCRKREQNNGKKATKNIDKLIATYVKVNLFSLIILCVATSGLVVYSYIKHLNANSLNVNISVLMEYGFSLFFEILGMVLSIIVTILAFDINELKDIKGAHPDYSLLKRIDDDKIDSILEVIVLNAGIYLFLMIGILRKYVGEIFNIKDIISDEDILTCAILGILLIVLKYILKAIRNHKNNKN